MKFMEHENNEVRKKLKDLSEKHGEEMSVIDEKE